MATDDFFDIGGIVYIVGNSPYNQMEGSFNLFKQEFSNLNADVTVRAISSENLTGTVDIRVSRKDEIDLNVNVMHKSDLTIDAEVEIVALSTIDLTVDIRPNTIAYGKFQLVEPPILTYNMLPMGDVFTRDYSDFATMNFGQDPIMITGRGSFQGTPENYNSYISFDIANFGARKIIKTAKLRLYYFDSDITPSSNVQLHEIAIPFSENGVTYYNQPQVLNKLFDNFTINDVDKYIEFEMLDFVKAVYDGTQFFNGFAITTNENKEYKFYTKESSKKPQLILTYIDKNINASVGFSDLTADVFIQGVGKSDRNFDVTIKSYNGLNSIDASMYVHKYLDPVPDDRDFDVKINNPEINATVTIVVNATDSVDGQMFVRQKLNSDRDFNVSISNPDVNATTFIRYNDYIDSNVTVRVSDNSDLDMDVWISNPEVNATMNIFFHDNKDVDGEVTIRVQDYNSLDMEMTVRNNVLNDIDGTVIISNPHISPVVEVRVNTKDERDFTVNIKGHYSDSRDFDVWVSNPHINMEAEVVESNYVDMEVSIREEDESLVDVEVEINNPEINNEVTIRAYKEEEINAEVIIRIEGFDNINMEVDISNPDVNASVMIPYRDNSYRDFTMTPRVRAVNDISINVRIKGLNDDSGYGFIL